MDFGAPHSPGSQVGPGAESLIFMLDPGKSVLLRRLCFMAAPPNLNAGLLVGTEDAVSVQGLPLPETLV